MNREFALMLLEKYYRELKTAEILRWLTEPREDDGGI